MSSKDKNTDKNNLNRFQPEKDINVFVPGESS